MSASMAVTLAETIRHAPRHYADAIPQRQAELAERAKYVLNMTMARSLGGWHTDSAPGGDCRVCDARDARHLYAWLSGYFLDVAAAAEASR